MVNLAMAEGISPLKAISKKEGISFDYLEKIISKLEKKGLVGAKKGVQGGYFLAKKPSKIKVGDIIRALEGEIYLVRCTSGENNSCPRKGKCLAKNFWKKIQDALNISFDSLTLADLIKNNK